MSKHGRHNPEPQRNAQAQAASRNPEPQRNPDPPREVNAFAWWRGPGGWEHVELRLPEAFVREHATQEHQPDLLGMVLARAANAIERDAR